MTRNACGAGFVRIPVTFLPIAFLPVALGIVFCQGLPARAGNGEVCVLPRAGVNGITGLRLEVDARGVDANGYRPVAIRVSTVPNAPAVADRSLRIELQASSWQWPVHQPVVTGYVEIPQGASRVNASISVPQFSGWESLQVICYEDGRRLEELCSAFNVNRINQYEWSESAPCVLIVDRDVADRMRRVGSANRPIRRGATPATSDLPDLRGLVERFSVEFGVDFDVSGDTRLTDEETLRIVDASARLELLHPSDLPQCWIDLTCFDLIYISAADLEWTAGQFPERTLALADWIRAGNALVVFDGSVQPEPLAELSASLGASPLDAANHEEAWQQVVLDRGDVQLHGVEVDYAVDHRRGERFPKDAELHRRRLGMGRVYAMKAADPLGADGLWLTAILNDLAPDNWMWWQRHGLSMHRINGEFGNWPIPGVGRSPVKSYLALITLFVIAIGPVNYLVLRKRKRLYLLLVTVPLGAGLVSSLLFSYALVTDGLGIRARIRSYTEIDQRVGRSVSWSRQTYYAGIAPSRGLEFPRNATVLPIEAVPSNGNRGSRRSRRLVWDDNQWLASGYLGSRSTVQFLVQQVQASQRGLRIQSASDGKPPEVTNQLDARLEHLLLRDESGKWYGAHAISPGQSFRPAAVAESAGLADLKAAYREHLPRFPEGYDANHYNRMRAPWYYGSNLSELDQTMGAPRMSHSLLERTLVERANGIGTLSPGSYVAIVAASPEVALATEGTREEASFHVILGRW